MFSAYTIRKVLPRLLIAVIAIQLSWSMVLLAVNINNQVAHGLQALFYAPFGGTGAFGLAEILQINGGSATGAAATAVFATAAAGGGFFVLGPGTLVGVLALAGTAALGVIIAIFTLVLRRAVLLFLIVIAPLAIVCWVLPGTEKFWKLWWESFSKLLLMYPLILLLVAAGRVFARVAASADAPPLLTYAMVVLGFFGPLFMIPATLKLAGTAFSTITSAVNNKGKGAFDRLRGVRDSQGKKNRDYHVGRMQNRSIAKRADLQNRWQSAASGRSGFSKFALAAASRRVGGRNIQAEAAAMQAKANKELGDQTNSGRDDEYRALTVNKKAALAEGDMNQLIDGHRSNGLMRINKESGQREFKTLGGAWVSEQAVDDGHKRWGKDRYAQQAALSYEMRKADTSEKVEGIRKRYGALALDDWGMNKDQASGALIGAGFENQNQHLEFKNSSLGDDPTGALKLNGKALASEFYEKKGTYAGAQFSAHTFEQLSKAYDDASRTVDPLTGQAKAQDTETMGKIEASMAQYVSEMSTGGGMLAPAAGGTPPVITPGSSNIQAMVPGSAATAQAARALAHKVGVYQSSGTPTPSPGPYPTSGPDSPGNRPVK